MTDTAASDVTQVYPQNYQPRGGHLAFPPDDCPYKDRFISYDDMVWLDNGICNNRHGLCKQKCERYKQYYRDKEWQKELTRLGELRKDAVLSKAVAE